MSYWDTSALAKLYVSEADSPYFLQLVATTDKPIISSAITVIEVLCVLYRKERERALKPGGGERIYQKFKSDINAGRILTIPFTRAVEAEAEKVAAQVFAHGKTILILRSSDLIHVSTAVSSKAREFVATDARLREAAGFVGLHLLP